jgi:KDO2-lipid IV(A) lauroyltransferase
MAKRRSPPCDFAVYLLVRIFVCIVQAIPLATGRSLARLLAWLAYHVDKRHREVALDNLRHAFPNQYTDAQLRRLVLDAYRHLGTLVIEMVYIPRKLHPHTWRRYIELTDGRQIVDVLLSGHPVLVVSGHFGNWELGGYVMAMFGFQTYGVARPLDNPYLDRFIRQFRERTGQRLLAKKGELDRIEDILQSGGIIGMLSDQDAGQKGTYVEFFGRPASTHKGIALLAMQHQAAILVSAPRKVGEPMKYEVRVTDTIWPEEYGAAAMTVRSLTQRFTSALERLIRLDPRQYFWLHRRWKHQPKQHARKAA